MQLPGQKSCCAGLQTGVLQCAGADKGSPIDGQPEDLALLFGKDSDSPVLAWRETTEDSWNFSHPQRLLVESEADPMLTVPELAGRFSSSRPIPATTQDGKSWWLLKLRDDESGAPFIRREDILAQYRVYPAAIVRSLGDAHRPSPKPLSHALTKGLFDDWKWQWQRIGVKRAKAGKRQVRLAILDDGYYPHKSHNSFVEACAQQNFTSASTLTNLKKSHGAACLHFASEVVRRSQDAAKVVTLVPYRVFADKACATDYRIMRALRHVADNAINIVVAPWLIRQRRTALEGAVAALENQGILFLTGPANKFLDLDDCSCGQEMAYWRPGNNVGVVGSVGQGDVWTAAFGATRVDVGAPGSSIYHRLIKRYRSGSSFAAPIAAAVVAVELTRQPKMSAIEVWKKLLKESSRCEGDHSDHLHCASQRIISFPEL